MAPEKTRVIPYGIEEPAPLAEGAEEEIRRRTDTPPGMLTVGIVGRLHPRKGHRDLFEAITILREGGFSEAMRLWVIGEGEDRSALEAVVADRELADIVHFVGPRTDAASLMSLLDLLVVPSLVETTPFVILEAMAAGKPVVASGIYGIPEMIEEGASGTLVEPSDPGALARALLPLLCDPDLRERFGKRARERYEQYFSAEQMARTTTAAYLGDGTGGKP
jgi:glycosyltransferase involved in cell wall biosynthesis